MRPGIASVAWFAALRSFALIVLGAFLFAASLRAAQDEPQEQGLLEQLLGEDRGVRDAAFERWLAQSSPADPQLAAALALHSERAWSALRRTPTLAEVKSALALRERLQAAQRASMELLAPLGPSATERDRALREVKLASAVARQLGLLRAAEAVSIELAPRPARLVADLCWNARACARAGLSTVHGALGEVPSSLLLVLDEDNVLTLDDLPRDAAARAALVEARRMEATRQRVLRERVSCCVGFPPPPSDAARWRAGIASAEHAPSWDALRCAFGVAAVRPCGLDLHAYRLKTVSGMSESTFLELATRGEPSVVEALLSGPWAREAFPEAAPRTLRVVRVPLGALDDRPKAFEWAMSHREEALALLDSACTHGALLEFEGGLVLLAAGP